MHQFYLMHSPNMTFYFIQSFCFRNHAGSDTCHSCDQINDSYNKNRQYTSIQEHIAINVSNNNIGITLFNTIYVLYALLYIISFSASSQPSTHCSVNLLEVGSPFSPDVPPVSLLHNVQKDKYRRNSTV